MKTKAKIQLIEAIPPIADLFIDVALGTKRFLNTGQEKAAHKIWETIAPILKEAADTADIPNLSAGSISDRVDVVMAAVASGQIDVNQGKKLIDMLQAGFDITELPKLIEKLEAAEESN